MRNEMGIMEIILQNNENIFRVQVHYFSELAVCRRVFSTLRSLRRFEIVLLLHLLEIVLLLGGVELLEGLVGLVVEDNQVPKIENKWTYSLIR